MKLVKKYIWAFLALLIVGSSCNEDYTSEQYEQYVSLKAPHSPVCKLRLKYRKDSVSPYKLPLIVSGTVINPNDLEVHVGLDADTLDIYNMEHYYGRKDLYYHLLEPEFYDIPDSVVHIKAGQVEGFLDINFNFKNLDLSENWILPLVVKDDPSYNYKSNPRKDYNNALLWILPFNDFSGSYGATNLAVYTDQSNKPIVVDSREGYVVDESTVFMYAGAVKERRPDRKNFKLYYHFEAESDSTGSVCVTADNPAINFQLKKQPRYYILKVMDTQRPTLLHKTIVIKDLEYTFEDPWETKVEVLKYKVKGTLSMQRNIDLSIPDEEYSIEW